MKKRVLAAVADLFFAARIRATAEALNVEIEFPRTAAALLDAARRTPPTLVCIDLHTQQLDPFALIAALKADESLRAIPVIGFFSHVQTELQQRARAAGCDRVLARSAFTKQLPALLTGAAAGAD